MTEVECESNQISFKSEINYNCEAGPTDGSEQ